MAVAAKKLQDDYGYAPTTRVYSHSRASVAEALPRYEPDIQVKTHVKRDAAPVAKPKRNIGKKLMTVLTIGVVAGTLMMLMIRYAQIAESYCAVNVLKNDIELREENIAALNVKLNSAIDIDAAREAAVKAGMGYPTADQIVMVHASDKVLTTDTAITGGTGANNGNGD
ncbi:MAG: hypothetical protein RR232_02270 [Clostridia bacterium]